MKITSLTITATSILVLAFDYLPNVYVQASQNKNAIETEHRAAETAQKTKKSKSKVNFVKMADFYLRNGNLVFGKLVSEDKNKITVEQLHESRIVVSIYSRREIDSRTLHTKNIPESNYYLELGDYFSGRTWDFKDDTDDFIQAIRCYRLAKQSARRSEKIEQIQAKIEQLEADKKVWIKEIESRAKLKKLEFEATLEARIRELEDKVDDVEKQIDSSIERFDKAIADMKGNFERLEKSISVISEGMSRQLEMLTERIEANRKLIDRRYRYSRYRYYPYYYHPSRRRLRPNPDE